MRDIEFVNVPSNKSSDIIESDPLRISSNNRYRSLLDNECYYLLGMKMTGRKMSFVYVIVYLSCLQVLQ